MSSPSPEWFAALLENVQDIVVLLGADGRLVYHSPAVERLLGQRAEEAIGSSVLDLLHPDDLPTAGPLLARAVAEPGFVGTITFRARHGDGTWRCMEAVGKNLLDDPAVRGLVLTCRDVTERVRAQEEARSAREAAERASLAKTEFLSRMSHELRTPMNAVLGFAQLLEMEVAEPSQRESVEQILRAGRHLLQLIDEALDIARIEEGGLALHPEPVRADEVAAQAVELLRPLAAGRRVELRLALAPHGGLSVLADPQRLRQILLNLLSNAVKYNRPGGSVTLAAEPGAAALRLHVRDTGPGIPPDRLPALFRPFERLGAEGSGVEGVGLGLALSRTLAERMGGTIGVSSRVGEGSDFWVELPRAAPPVGVVDRDLQWGGTGV